MLPQTGNPTTRGYSTSYNSLPQLSNGLFLSEMFVDSYMVTDRERRRDYVTDPVSKGLDRHVTLVVPSKFCVTPDSELDSNLKMTNPCTDSKP